MIIGGLEKFSLIDYPEHLSAIIFTSGCNFRCQFCYNPMLVVPEEANKLQNKKSDKGGSQITEDSLFHFLQGRIGKLDAVVITGGEPTLHDDLPDFLKKIKELGFKIKLDSNGTNPEMLDFLLKEKLLDYLAMDIKGTPKKYDLVVGVQPDLNKIRKSIKIIKTSRLPYEFRTTIVPGLVAKEDIFAMGKEIQGANKWYLQKFKSNTDLVNENYEGVRAYSDKEMEAMQQIAQKYVKFCAWR